MKKIVLVLSVLFLIPIGIFAASPNVKTLDATISGTTITYNGIVEDGSYAVMCKLYNADKEEIDLLSSSVDNNAFEGKFENVAKGSYTVKCANYEGGDFTEAVVKEGKNTVDTNNPATLDNINLYVVSGVVALIVLVASVTYLRKKNVKNR